MSLRWRIIGVALLLLLFGFLAFANFLPEDERRASALLPDDGMRLGLDLRGGIHWVLGPQLAAAVESELDHLRSALQTELAEQEIVPERLVVEEDRILVTESSPERLQEIRNVLGGYDVLRVVEENDRGTLTLALIPDWEREVRETGMLQALEVLRRRIDDPSTGIPESVVTRQGRDRILVQIPGVEQVPQGILDTTGFLEFKIVEAQAESEALLRARYSEGLPEEREILFERDRETDRILQAYLVPAPAAITGDYLDDARPRFDQRSQRWVVDFTFKPEGGRLFGELSEANVGNQLAIVLDDQIYSAPVIQERISMRGQITGRFSSQQAKDLAVILRAGSLPIPVVIEEERTVGPALGADSIRSGLNASIIGLALVLVFGTFYYRYSGAYASLGLLANLVLIIGIMSLAGATLTLPGIVGIVLTVGMAIDANVIIFERIREELRQGKTPRAAIATGFSKARWTVLDANITTLITAIILYEFGTGPVKGFAVTLSVGILTSVFAALVITRLLFEIYPGNRNVAGLSI
ncbi:MAG: protein translocase subunit SecD [Myxococcota bacterium]